MWSQQIGHAIAIQKLFQIRALAKSLPVYGRHSAPNRCAQWAEALPTDAAPRKAALRK